MRVASRSNSRCPTAAGSSCSTPQLQGRLMFQTQPTRTTCRPAPSRCSSNPGRESHLERMGEELVPRIGTDAVVEHSRKAGLEVDAKALLGRVPRAGRRELVGV